MKCDLRIFSKTPGKFNYDLITLVNLQCIQKKRNDLDIWTYPKNPTAKRVTLINIKRYE